MNPTPAQLRSDFAEFADTSKYPDSLVTMWMTVACVQVANSVRWDALLITAQELVAAHYLVLSARDRAAAVSGGAPGGALGLQTAKSVGDLSVSYDYSALLSEDAGFWNQTTYGQRYWQLARLIGAGGIQLPSSC